MKKEFDKPLNKKGVFLRKGSDTVDTNNDTALAKANESLYIGALYVSCGNLIFLVQLY